MQIRSVECVDIHGAHNTQCEPGNRPASVQSCSTGISCTSETPTTDFQESSSSESPNGGNLDENLDDVTEEEDDGLQKTSKAAAKAINDDETEEEDDDVDMQGDDPAQRNRKIPMAYQYRIPRAERLVDPNAPNEPT